MVVVSFASWSYQSDPKFVRSAATSVETEVEKNREWGEDLLRTEFRVSYNSCRLDQRNGIRGSCLGFTSDTQCPGMGWPDNEAVKFNLREDRSLTRLSGQRQVYQASPPSTIWLVQFQLRRPATIPRIPIARYNLLTCLIKIVRKTRESIDTR